jgi:hypothetical protein
MWLLLYRNLLTLSETFRDVIHCFTSKVAAFYGLQLYFNFSMSTNSMRQSVSWEQTQSTNSPPFMEPEGS